MVLPILDDLYRNQLRRIFFNVWSSLNQKNISGLLMGNLAVYAVRLGNKNNTNDFSMKYIM